MSYSVTATWALDLGYTSELTDGVVINREQPNLKQPTKTNFTAGSGSQQVNQHYYLRDTLTAASGVMDIDLSTVSNRQNPIAGFSAVKVFVVRNLSVEDGANLVVSSGVSNGWVLPGDGSAWNRVIGPGGEDGFKNPYDGILVFTSNGTIRLTHDGPSSGDITFDLLVIGNS